LPFLACSCSCSLLIGSSFVVALPCLLTFMPSLRCPSLLCAFHLICITTIYDPSQMKRKANAYNHIRSLASLPVRVARKLIGDIVAASAAGIDIENLCSSERTLLIDYHAVFDTISCVDEFAYIGRETESWSLEYLEPSLLVQTILSQNATASEYFALALAQYEGTKMNPLSCVIGFDEFQSGSLNRPDSSKKYMCLYFTFLELSLPSQDLLWFCPQVSRTVKLGQIVGGWSHVLARFLKRMFLGPCGFSTTGVTFAYKNRDYIFYAKL
jgi:hypothetical protein